MRRFNGFLARNPLISSQIRRTTTKIELPEIEDKKEEYSMFYSLVMRGMGQCAFTDNVVSGVMITGALAATNPYVAAVGILGCASSTLTALILKCPPSLVNAGLYGFNGVLFSGGAYLFLPHSPSLLVVASVSVVGSALITPLSSILLKRMSTPILSIPFNAAIVPSLFAASFVPSNVWQTIERKAVEQIPEVSQFNGMIKSSSIAVNDILCGIGQMILSGSPASGALILVAVLAHHYRNIGAGLEAISFTIGGSAVGTLMHAFVFESPPDLISMGIFGFNPALTALGIYSFIGQKDFSLKSALSLNLLIYSGCFLSVFLNKYLSPLFAEYLSTPGAFGVSFCIAASLSIFIGRKIPTLKSKM